MSKCSYCGKEVDVEWDTGFIWTNMDGDLVCSEKCHKAYEKEKNYFLESILPNDSVFAAWLGVPLGWMKNFSSNGGNNA